MIIPSIDLRGGRAVQLRRGREFLFDGGDPLDRLAEFALAGEVAVVDLDAALGTGSEPRPDPRDGAALSLPGRRRHSVRRAGARLARRRSHPRGGRHRRQPRVLSPAAARARRRRHRRRARPRRRRRLADRDRPRPAGRHPRARAVRRQLLFTQVEREGGLAGDPTRAPSPRSPRRPRPSAARVTAAGGISTATEVAALDALGVDAQVGVALYRDVLPLADAVSAPLAGEGPWPTVVCDEAGRALGLVWSTRKSCARPARAPRDLLGRARAAACGARAKPPCRAGAGARRPGLRPRCPALRRPADGLRLLPPRHARLLGQRASVSTRSSG